MQPSLSVVLPCYNEELAIQPVLSRLLSLCDEWELRGVFSQCEVIVVDDGSTDNSLKILNSFAKKIKVIPLKQNCGYGFALKKGFEAAQFDFIAFFDLDETCDPKDIVALCKDLKNHDADLILGNRLHQQSQMPFHRQFGNKFYRFLINKFLRVHISDSCTGFRVFKSEHKKLFTHQLPNDLNYSLAMTVVAFKAQLKVIQANINYSQRTGVSKLNSITHGLQFLKTVMDYSTK